MSETFDCDDVLHDLEHFIDGELDAERSAHLATHLGECSPCLRHADFQRKLKEIVRSKCQEEAALPGALLERIRLQIRGTATAGE